jgi:hypothetical protein
MQNIEQRQTEYCSRHWNANPWTQGDQDPEDKSFMPVMRKTKAEYENRWGMGGGHYATSQKVANSKPAKVNEFVQFMQSFRPH